MYDVVIIGAGVSGCAIARELSRQKGSILVVERDEDVCCGTTKANSAIVHAGYDATNGSLMAKLNVQGSEMMPELAKELDFHYKQNGSIVACMSEEDRPNLMKLYENGVKNESAPPSAVAIPAAAAIVFQSISIASVLLGLVGGFGA